MAGERTLTVRLVGRDDGASRVLNNLDGAAGRVGGVMGKLGTLAVAGTAAAGVAVGAFLTKAVMSASDLAETMSKVGVVFGESTKQVTAFADGMAGKFGIPKREILDAAASIGLVGKASGLSQPAAAKMSTELARLAADASSFYNVPLPEALDAMKSGLVGEAEPMRRFGVLLSESAVQAEAVALGIAKTGEKLTEAQKVQARSSLIMKGMSDASGDLERTQGSLANRIRELKGRAENFATSVGTALLPLVLKAFDGFEKLQKVVGPPLQSAFNTLRNGVSALGAAFSGEGVTSNGFVGGMERIGVTVRRVFTGIATFVAENRGTFEQWGAKLQEVVGKVGGILTSLAEVFQIYVGVIMNLWDRFGSHILDFIVATISNVVAAISGALQIIQGVLDVFIGVFTGDWSRAWEGVKGIVSGALNLVLAIIKQTLNMVSTVLGGAMAAISAAWGYAWNAITATVSKVKDTILGVFKGAASWLLGIGGDIIAGLARGITGAAGKIVAAIKSAVIDKIPDPIKKFFGLRSPSRLMMGYGENIGEGLAIGIRNSAAMVAAASSSLNSAVGVPSGGAIGRSSLAAAGGGGGGVNIYVTVQGSVVGVAGPDELAEIIHSKLLRIGMRNGGSVGLS